MDEEEFKEKWPRHKTNTCEDCGTVIPPWMYRCSNCETTDDGDD